MISKIRLFYFLAVLAAVLLCYYTYKSILMLGFEENIGATASLVHMFFVIMAIIVMAVSGNKIQTGFSMLWLFWVFWLLIDFFVLGLRGEGVANIFHVTFAPMTFMLYYTIGMYPDERREKLILVGFFVLYGVAYYMNISNLSYLQIDIEEETAISNLVYWCLCVIPFLLLVKRQWLQIIFLLSSIIIVLLTSKRSATITILLIAFVYILYQTKGSKHRIRNLVMILLGVLALYYLVSKYFINSYNVILERMSNVEEDQGSGRVPLYYDVFGVMQQNTMVDWLLGRGYGSIIITRHTNAHNDALQMLFEYGVVGLLFYVLMLWYAVKRVIKLRILNSSYYIGYLASLFIFIVLGLVSNLVVFYSYFSFICAYWGLAEAELVRNNSIKKIVFE